MVALLAAAAVFVVGYFNTPREGAKALLRTSSRAEVVADTAQAEAYYARAAALVGKVNAATPPEEYVKVADDLQALSAEVTAWDPIDGLDPYAAVLREMVTAEVRLVDELVGQWEVGAALQIQDEMIALVNDTTVEARRRLDVFVTRNELQEATK